MSLSAGTEVQMSDLIGHLYDAAMDERLWTGIAPRIAAAFESSSAVLKMSGADGGVQLLDSTENLNVAERDRAWADHWHRNDLWVERSVAYGLSRVITSRDLVSTDEEGRSPFYQEWLRHLDIHHMVGAVFPAGDDRIGVLGIHRPRASGPYARAERAKAALLLPHLQRALHLGRHFGRTAFAQTAALDVLDRLDAGVLVVERSRRIVHANALAQAMLRDNAEIGVLNGRLVVRHVELNARLAVLVQDNAEIARGHPPAPPPLPPPLGALAIPRDDRLPLTLAVAPLRSTWSGDGRQPLALVFLRDPERPTPMLEQLRDLFGLTRTEAAIATELARGRSLAEIAGALGVGQATTRSHLKKILAKTGTSRQAEAVSLIGRCVAAVFDR
jgi:DNA-binding CsgD family transcriptional regulator